MHAEWQYLNGFTLRPWLSVEKIVTYIGVYSLQEGEKTKTHKVKHVSVPQRGNNHRISIWNDPPPSGWPNHVIELLRWWNLQRPPPYPRRSPTHPHPSSWQLHGFSVEGSSGVIIHNTCCLARCRLSRYSWRHHYSIHYPPALQSRLFLPFLFFSSCSAKTVCTKKIPMMIKPLRSTRHACIGYQKPLAAVILCNSPQMINKQ